MEYYVIGTVTLTVVHNVNQGNYTYSIKINPTSEHCVKIHAVEYISFFPTIAPNTNMGSFLFNVRKDYLLINVLRNNFHLLPLVQPK